VATNGPLVNPQVMYEHGEPRWNDIDRERRLLILHESSLKPYQQTHVVAKEEDLAKEMMNLAVRSIFVLTSKRSYAL
jgi:hypothetical protein